MEIIKIRCATEIPDDFTGIAEYPNGDRGWYKEEKLHREGGPALVLSDGTKFWRIEGIRHRTDGPAVEYPDGTKEWWIEGKRHRIDGPAIEETDGTKEWWIEGKNYSENKFKSLTELSIFLGKEKNKYGLEWLKFLTEEGIKEFAIVPGMEFVKHERISDY